MSSVLEKYRELVVSDALNTPSFKDKVWEKWKTWIQNYSNDYTKHSNIRKLGENLSEMFRSTRGNIDTGYEDPTQNRNSIVSIGGTAWQTIIIWYLNLLGLGTNYVVIPRKKLITPDPIYKGTNILIFNEPAGKEPDLYLIGFHTESDLLKDFEEMLIKYKDSISAIKEENKLYQLVDAISKQEFNEYEIGILQTKTNWNDLVQGVAMWNLIYKHKHVFKDHITFGETYTIKDLKYSFITVPSNTDNSKFKSSNTAVKRAKTFSGGNYWGRPSEKGVANSIWQIFTTSYKKHFTSSNEEDFKKYVKENGIPKYFNI